MLMAAKPVPVTDALEAAPLGMQDVPVHKRAAKLWKRCEWSLAVLSHPDELCSTAVTAVCMFACCKEWSMHTLPELQELRHDAAAPLIQHFQTLLLKACTVGMRAIRRHLA
jgi:hypothetical protein